MPTKTRTQGLRIKSPLLYQLSYEHMKWYSRRDSNPQQFDFESNASANCATGARNADFYITPILSNPEICKAGMALAPKEGLEPPAHCLEGSCSIHLSYLGIQCKLHITMKPVSIFTTQRLDSIGWSALPHHFSSSPRYCSTQGCSLTSRNFSLLRRCRRSYPLIHYKAGCSPVNIIKLPYSHYAQPSPVFLFLWRVVTYSWS